MTAQIQSPNAYQDISERESLAYCLNYTMAPVIKEFTSIPDDKMFAVAYPGQIPPAWIFAHLAAHEYRAIQKAFCLNDHVPDALQLCQRADDKELQRLAALHPSKDQLVGHWKAIREKTIECLLSLRDEQLKDVYPGQCKVCADHAASGKGGKPPFHDPCFADPFRELFVQLITHQNYCLGQLHVIRCLATGTRDVWAKW